MFKKILIANRGEIAVRIVRTCREMGIPAVALYEKADQGSLHVRLADEAVEIAATDFMDADRVLAIAQERGVDAVHPGYGFLAEESPFIRACADSGITFIGPPADIVDRVRDKLDTLSKVRAAGFPTVESSPISFGLEDLEALREAADELEYPLVIMSCSGGRGPAERLVRAPQTLLRTIERAQAEARAVYGNQRVYLERAIMPAHQLAVQVLADQEGNLVHLGEREGSLLRGSRKLIEESPSPSLSETQRSEICETAVAITRLIGYENAGTVEFLMDADGNFYFTEIKSRIQVEHPLTEMLTRIDLVREQLRIAAGEPLGYTQQDVVTKGWAMLCRVNAEDPWNHFMPSPGRLQTMRLPGGPEIRVDTYMYCGCYVPPQYDPLIAKLIVWGADREACLQRMGRALEDFKLVGTATNLPLLQRVFAAPEFSAGVYSTGLLSHRLMGGQREDSQLRDLAVAAALLFLRRNEMGSATIPDRVRRGWHRSSRRLPQ